MNRLKKWKVMSTPEEYFIMSENNGAFICNVGSTVRTQNMEIAKLIASAPEAIQLLKVAIEHWPLGASTDDEVSTWREDATLLVEKALSA